MTGQQRWHVLGFYINPSYALTIEYITVAIGTRTYGDGLLVDVDLNANLAGLEGTPRDEVIADKLAAADIVDMGLHFLPRRKPWLQDRCTWIMRKNRRYFWSQTDYILVMYSRLFQDVAVWDPQHNLDHYMVLGFIRGEPEKELTKYLCKA